ncbi:MAG: hypothetical protein HOC09_01115 [Deltaproteobacteria bacterium]|nr:hypothetical protein [Deltaproteobacteria bacterium]
MTIAITNTATIIGIDAHVIEVEADVSIGRPFQYRWVARRCDQGGSLTFSK